MSRIALVLVLTWAAVAMGQTTQPASKVPDLSMLDADGLRILATNLYQKVDALDRRTSQLLKERDEARAETKAEKTHSRELATRFRSALISEMSGDPKLLSSLADDELITVALSKSAAPKIVRNAEIKKAIAEKRLVVGMTIEDANQALHVRGERVGGGEGFDEYSWKIFAGFMSKGTYIISQPLDLITEWTAFVKNGKIDSFQKS